MQPAIDSSLRTAHNCRLTSANRMYTHSIGKRHFPFDSANERTISESIISLCECWRFFFVAYACCWVISMRKRIMRIVSQSSTQTSLGGRANLIHRMCFERYDTLDSFHAYLFVSTLCLRCNRMRLLASVHVLLFNTLTTSCMSFGIVFVCAPLHKHANTLEPYWCDSRATSYRC